MIANYIYLFLILIKYQIYKSISIFISLIYKLLNSCYKIQLKFNNIILRFIIYIL